MLMLAAAGSSGWAVPQDITVRERTIVQRAHGRVVELEGVAPTGLPLAHAPRVWMRGDEIRGGGPAWAEPVHWATPRRTEAEILAAVSAAGYRARSARAQHRPDGSVAWWVDVAFDPHTRSRPVVWVDDSTGEVRRGLEQVRAVAAAAFARNPVLDEAPTVFELEGLADPPEDLRGPLFDVRQCEDPGVPGACVPAVVPPSEAGDFVFDVPMSAEDHARGDDLFAAASLAVHAQRYEAFAARHGLPLAPCLETQAPGVLLANYRGFTAQGEVRVANAGYTGDCSLLAFFGQGPDADWSYDADVVLHELAHGTIAALIGEGRVLGGTRRRPDAVVQDAGAINEGLADFVAAVITGDPGHAEYVRAYEGGWMRDATHGFVCPSDLRGEIHYDGEPVTGALWAAYEQLGEDLVEPALDAVALLDEDATFEEYAAAVLMLTEEALGPDAHAVLEAALADHGLVDCARVADWDALEHPLWVLPRFGSYGYFTPMRPPALQVRLDVPADAVSATVQFETVVVPQAGWEPIGDVHVLVQSGAPIAFSYSVDEDARTTVEASPDLHLASVNDGSFTLDVEPGQPTYLAFFNQGQHVVQLSGLEVTFEVADVGSSGAETPTTGDSGDTDGAPASSEGGAGCSVAGGAPWATTLLMLLLVGGRCRRSRGRPR